MPIPIIAIVGRPNVGKSTLFNRLLGGRRAIVDDMPGVTRDRLYGEGDWRGRRFVLVDTGGFEPEGTGIMAQVRAQAKQAIAEADVILFLVDGKEGLTPADVEVARLLRMGKPGPILLVVNKVDDVSQAALTADFYRLGFDPVCPVSAEAGQGIGDLLDAVMGVLPEAKDEAAESEAITVAVVGRPNVGKSSLVNRILGADRVLVSSEPGTTRDAIDTRFSYRGRDYILVDTAGIRAKGRLGRSVERYSVSRALAAVRRADVVLLLIDGAEGVTAQDTKVGGEVVEAGCASRPGREQVGLSRGTAGRSRRVPPHPAGAFQVPRLRADGLRVCADRAPRDEPLRRDRRRGRRAGAPHSDVGTERGHPGGCGPPAGPRGAGPPRAHPVCHADRDQAADVRALHHDGGKDPFLLHAVSREQSP